MSESGAPPELAQILSPYVPRMVSEWLEHTPRRRHKEIEGTLVFVDVSGFTALSEKLGRRGKVGAEDVTDVIGSTFTELLVVAYQAGGSLLKFGGDALMLFFTSDGHERRACWAAARMRATLRGLNPIVTQAGNVRLGMSVGIASGKYHFFLVGESHRELLLTGPAVTEATHMESAASRGEILIGARTASALPPNFVGASRANGYLLHGTPPDPKIIETPSAPAPVSGLEQLVPTAVRDYLLAGEQSAEHRLVTAGFLRFSGVDDALRDRGPASVGQELHKLICRAQRAAEANSVCFLSTDLYADGGKIIFTAGVPYSAGDDADRMIRAAHSVADGWHGFDLTVGIHCGHLFAGSIGPSYRRTYTVMGDTVNTAARVMSAAKPGEILATRIVLDNASNLYEAEPLPPVSAKGKRELLEVAKVGKPLGRRRTTSTPFVGRQRELKILNKAIKRAGSSIRVTGEAGMGKTRLVREVLSHTKDINVVQAQVDPSQAAVAYSAFRQLYSAVVGSDARSLTDVVDKHAAHLRPWLPLLAMPLGLRVAPTPEVDRIDDAFRARQLQRTVMELLENVVQEPTCWLIEDANEVDPASATLLARLSASADKRNWCVMFTARTIDPALDSLGEGIHLDALDDATSTELATKAAGGRILPERARMIAQRAGGNPLFIQELVDSPDDEELPGQLESVVAARIDRLTPADRALLRQLAVLGRSFDTSIIKALSADVADVRQRLGDFIQSDSRGLHFRQALFQEVAYEGLPFRTRRVLHERAAALIESTVANPEEVADILSLHFARAGDHSQAWRYASTAGKQARDRFAHAEAAVLLRRALAASARIKTVEPDILATTWQDLGESLTWSGRLAEARVAYRSGRNAAQDPAITARLLQREGSILARIGKPSDALRAYTRGLRTLDTAHKSDGRWRLTAAYASARREQGRYTQAVKWAQEALADAESEGDELGAAHAHNLLHMIYDDMNDPRSRGFGEVALKAFESAGQTRFAADVLNNLGVDANHSGNWDEALDFYQRAATAHAQSGNALGAAVVDGNVAVIMSDQGKWLQAEEIFRRVIGTFEAAGFTPGVQWVKRNLGQLLSRTGRHDEAQKVFAEALDDVGDSPDKQTVEAWQAEDLAHQARPNEALEMAQRINDEALLPLVERVKGIARAQLGNTETAREHFERSLELARSVGNAFEEALTLSALAELENRSDYVKRARSILKRLGVVATARPNL